jgi:hypothetical protein
VAAASTTSDIVDESSNGEMDVVEDGNMCSICLDDYGKFFESTLLI